MPRIIDPNCSDLYVSLLTSVNICDFWRTARSFCHFKRIQNHKIAECVSNAALKTLQLFTATQCCSHCWLIKCNFLHHLNVSVLPIAFWIMNETDWFELCFIILRNKVQINYTFHFDVNYFDVGVFFLLGEWNHKWWKKRFISNQTHLHKLWLESVFQKFVWSISPSGNKIRYYYTKMIASKSRSKMVQHIK